MLTKNKRIIGLVPAAGQATRLSPLPFSKELYPIGHMRLKGSDDLRPKPVCIYLLEKMKVAGIKDVFIVLRKGKWDIPGYLGDGSALDMSLAYLIMNLPFGVPYTLDQAFPFIKDAIVVFGFPDIIFQPDDAFVSLLAKQSESNADVVLGLFTANKPHETDMVDLDAYGRVREIQIRPTRTYLHYAWIIAVWTPLFTNFMHKLILANQRKSNKNQNGTRAEEHSEYFVGEVIQAAMNNGLLIEGVVFSNGAYLDIGTPDNIIKAVEKNALC